MSMTNGTEKPGSREKNEKRNWFHSLSRRKKSSPTTKSGSELLKQPSNIGNNVSVMDGPSVATVSTVESSSILSTRQQERRRQGERKNVFQRIRKCMGLHFAVRQKKLYHEDGISGAIERNVEQLLSSPSGLQTVSPSVDLEPSDMIPFSYQYRRFAAKKWLDDPSRPNRVMYKACCEMLNQVWYWGEISRHDAQRQLTDKPVGTFLVRDSESGGSSSCWYTLSFRIRNCTLHHRLECRDNLWNFLELQYPSIVGMIDDILYRSAQNNFLCFVGATNEMQPPQLVALRHPLSRYIKMMTLQDLCRRVIQRHTSVERINELQIPVKLQEYLRETHELVFQSL